MVDIHIIIARFIPAPEKFVSDMSLFGQSHLKIIHFNPHPHRKGNSNRSQFF